jgi:hypothetical protein
MAWIPTIRTEQDTNAAKECFLEDMRGHFFIDSNALFQVLVTMEYVNRESDFLFPIPNSIEYSGYFKARFT